MTKHTEFLAGERPEDVLFFLHEDAVSNPGALAEYADEVEDGHVLVLPGDDGRSAFQSATGIDDGTGSAGDGNRGRHRRRPDRRGLSDRRGGAGERPHDPIRLRLRRGTERGRRRLYAEGDVVHAYAVCACGERYSDKWVVGE